MTTPIYDFLCKYINSKNTRCHMPGHHGNIVALRKHCSDDFLKMLSFDITEIDGADSLFDASGIIAESERNAAELFKTAYTCYSAGGSTLGIQSMLAVMKSEKRRIIAVRNAHRALLNAAALLDMEIDWVYPDCTCGILSGEINIDEISAKLTKCDEPVCVYITSPDYTGRIADIGAVSAVCKKHNARLIVDNAHGSHLAFMGKHPISLGADLCCDSAHKTLPVLTGGAYVHTSDPSLADKIKPTMKLFASTSPSYLILASLDICNAYISDRMPHDIAVMKRFSDELKTRFPDTVFIGDDPFHLTVDAQKSGFNGREFADILRKQNIEPEYADDFCAILLFSPIDVSNTAYIISAIEKALANIKRVTRNTVQFSLPRLERAMSIRNAVFAPNETIPTELAEGRICSAVNVPCPPAVPIAVSGELINRECIDIFIKYGIAAVNVVKP